MSAVNGFRTAEEAALDLELPLLATVRTAPDGGDGPIAPDLPTDAEIRSEYKRAADRVLLSPLARTGSVGVVGDSSSAHRARVCGHLAAVLASDRTTILLDADLRAAHLSFDERGRAQEGLVDVLRYGVRSPRLVAPTLAPGLSLLPVGADTVDYPGTYESQSLFALFEELSRSGDLLVVNAPGPGDLDAARPFMQQVGAWILLHELGRSDPGVTRNLRDWLGRERCVGILAVESSVVSAAGMPAAGTPAAGAPAASPEPRPFGAEAAAIGGPPVPPAEGTPPPPRPWTESRIDDSYLREEPRHRTTVWLFGIVAVVAAAAAFFWLRTGPGEIPMAGEGPPPPAAIRGGSGPAEVRGPGAAEREGPTATAPDEAPATAESAAPAERGPADGDATAVPPPPETAASEAPPARPATAWEVASEKVDRAAPVGTTAGRLWGVHIASVRSAEGAQREAAKLERAGYPTVLRPVELAGKGRWVRIYLGPYGDREAAQETAGRVKASGLTDYTQIHRLPESELRGGTGREDR